MNSRRKTATTYLVWRVIIAHDSATSVVTHFRVIELCTASDYMYHPFQKCYRRLFIITIRCINKSAHPTVIFA